MKIHVVRSFALLVGASLATAGLTVAVSTAQAAESTNTIVGSITDRAGYPLKGIKVDLFAGNGDSGDIVKTVRTDDTGRYRAKVPTDSYPGYALPTDPTGNHVGPAVEFQVSAGTTKVPTMKLYKAAVIRGSVTRNDGENSANLLVSLETRNFGGLVYQVTPSGTFQALVMPGKVSVSFGDNQSDYATHCLDGSVPDEGEGCAEALDLTVKQGQVVTLDPLVLTHPGGE